MEPLPLPTSPRSTTTTRRQFLKASSVALGFPAIIPASALGKAGRPAPSERLTLGCIGTGNNGVNWLRNFMGDDRVQVVSVCDVCEESAAYWANSVRGREPARKLVDEQYGKGCKSVEDYRELLADKGIDAVQIATPDHWHGIHVTSAAKAGKHIYGQKPLSLTIEQGRAMSDAVKADGLKLVVNDGRDGVRGGVTFEGEGGKWIWVNRGRLDANPKELLRTELKEGDEHTYVSNNHVGNFVDCVFSGAEPIAPIEAAHRTISIAHLGNIALRLGREEIEWDPATEKIRGDVAASKMLGREMRAPYKLA